MKKKSTNKSNLLTKNLFLILAGKLLANLVMKTILSHHLFLLCMLMPFLGSGQFVLVTGNIIDGKTGSAIGNGNIFESNSGIGTITNMSGFFSLMLKPGNAEMVISHDGFKDFSQKMILKSDTVLVVSLVPILNLKSKPKETKQQKTAENLKKSIGNSCILVISNRLPLR